MSEENQVILDARGITKRFPGVLANDHVNFDLRKGEIHALLGENGAGKSTLMNVLYGLYKADEGQIMVDGKEMILHSPKDVIHHGIGMVHQHFMLIPVFTVTENIMLGAETDHRANTDVQPVSLPPAIAVGDDLLDRLTADRPHPDLHQRDA